MATFTKKMLSGSVNGLPILVSAIATPGTLIHTAVAGVTSSDEIWLYVTNNHTSAVNLTLEWGGSTQVIRLSIPVKAGLTLVIPGFALQNGLVVRAFAEVTNVILVFGYVHRIE